MKGRHLIKSPNENQIKDCVELVSRAMIALKELQKSECLGEIPQRQLKKSLSQIKSIDLLLFCRKSDLDKLRHK